MTAIALDERPTETQSAGRRIWNVVRLHVANPMPTLVMPWIITLAIFALNMAIWLMVVKVAGGVDNLDEGAFTYSGGVTWIIFFMPVVAVQTMNLNFRFALGFSVTRRDFYLGSAAYFVALSVLYATGITVLAGVERATNGWGIEAAFFAPWGLGELSLVSVWAIFLMSMLLVFFLGAAVATMWVRWKAYGLYAFFIGAAVLVVGVLWAITAANGWSAVGDFLTDHSIVTLVAFTLPLTLACAVFGYVCLRKATPRA
jgi:hypothetical protein